MVFSSIHQSKGSERKYCILFGFDDSYNKYYNKHESPYICPNTLYVACTRASEELLLIQSNDCKPLEFLDYKNIDF